MIIDNILYDTMIHFSNNYLVQMPFLSNKNCPYFILWAKKANPLSFWKSGGHGAHAARRGRGQGADACPPQGRPGCRAGARGACGARQGAGRAQTPTRPKTAQAAARGPGRAARAAPPAMTKDRSLSPRQNNDRSA